MAGGNSASSVYLCGRKLTKVYGCDKRLLCTAWYHDTWLARTTQTAVKLVSYPDPNVRNDDYRLQYNILCTLYYTVSDNAYVRLGLGTRLL